jgi:hypothetical protein
MTGATAHHADARLAPSPAKVATCLDGEVPRDASASPTRPEPLGTATGDASSSPASPDTPDASPRAFGVPCGASDASAALGILVERPLLPGEARATRSTSSKTTAVRERKPSLPKTHWVPDKDAKACGNKPCSKPFTVLLRRHHCRACGLVFCKQCVDARLLLDPETAEPVTKASSTSKKKAIAARVCVDCYERAFRAANLENETRQRVVSCPGGSLEDENAHRLRNAEESSEESDDDARDEAVPNASPRMSIQSESVSESFPSSAASESVSFLSTNDSEDSSSRTSARSGRSVTLRRNPPTAFLSARTRIEALAEDPEGYERSVGAATPARDKSASSSKDASFDDDADAFASRSSSASPRLNAHTPLASPLETAEGRRVRRETAALLEAVTPALRAGAEETPGLCEETFECSNGVSSRSPADGAFSANDASSSSPRRLVARFARQLREQARLTEDAAAAAREAQRRAAATEEELALARAQVRRMGALWEELTNARRELESARGPLGSGAEKQSQNSCARQTRASSGSGPSSSLLATFETKFVNSGASARQDSNKFSGKWSECVVWHSATPKKFGGLSFQDCDSGVTRRVRHCDITAVRAAFDAATGACVLAVTLKEDTDAFASLGSCVRCRVDGPVTANRWALEIQKHLDANTT